MMKILTQKMLVVQVQVSGVRCQVSGLRSPGTATGHGDGKHQMHTQGPPFGSRASLLSSWVVLRPEPWDL